MSSWQKIAKGIALVGQIGFSLITPPVLMTLLGYWLSMRFQLGSWVIIVFMIFGLLAAFSTAYSMYKRIIKDPEGADEKRPASFRDHI